MQYGLVEQHRRLGCPVHLGTSDPTGFAPLHDDAIYCNSLNEKQDRFLSDMQEG